MRGILRNVGLCLILILFSGCKIITVIDPANVPLRGNLEIKQSNHVAQLRLSIEDPTSNNYPGPRFGTDPYRANCFVFTIFGKEKDLLLSSVAGNYQYENGLLQKLDVAYVNSSNAVLFTESNKHPDPASGRANCMDFGRYKLNVEYALNGQNYSCQFDVNYVLKEKRIVTYFWDLGKLGGAFP